MKYSMKKLLRAVAFTQLSLLLLWVVFFPLHIIFDLSDADHNNPAAISHHEGSCCGKAHAVTVTARTAPNLQALSLASICSICDFAAQLSESDLALVFSFQFFTACIPRVSQAITVLLVAVFSFYDSRAPPSELIA